MLLPEIASASVIHLHQMDTMLSDVVCFLARALDKRVFVTDLGGDALELAIASTATRLSSGTSH